MSAFHFLLKSLKHMYLTNKCSFSGICFPRIIGLTLLTLKKIVSFARVFYIINWFFHFPSATKTSDVWVNIQNPDFVTCNSPAACDLKFRNFDGTPVSTLHFSAIAVNPVNEHHLCLVIGHNTNAGKLSHTNCQNKKRVLCEAICGEDLGSWLQQPTSSWY